MNEQITQPKETLDESLIYVGGSIPTVYVNAINPKTPLDRVEKLALTSAIIHKHPLRHFREVWKEIDPETKEEKIVGKNNLHKYYNDVVRRVQETGYTKEDIKKLGYDNYISFFKGMAEGGKDEREQNKRWWKAINMSPEKEGAWLYDNNINYHQYVKRSNKVWEGWGQGGMHPSFRNSPYNKLGLLMSGVVALPALPVLTEIAAPVVEGVVSALPTISSGVGHGLKVLANPMAAKTTLGVLTAAGVDAAGTIYGLQRNSELMNKWSNGQFNWSDIPEFGINMIPSWTVSKVMHPAVSGAAQRGMNSLRTTWNAGKKVRPNYENWGGEFIDNVSVNSYSPIRPWGQNTKFKTTEYPGGPGTYNGKEVPAWQLSKGQRNLLKSPYIGYDINRTLNTVVEQKHQAPPINPEYLENSLAARADYKKRMADKFGNYFDDTQEFNKTLQQYIDGLPQEIDPRFASLSDGEIVQPSIAVRGYRNYLRAHGVDAVDISDNDLARLLTQEYKNLSNSASGKLKNNILWHGSDTWFDSFDYGFTSKNTGNSGALGPGNYFSLQGVPYGHSRSNWSYRMHMNNFQPYIISNVQSTPPGQLMIKKGILPEYISTASLRGNVENQNTLQKLISEIPLNDNRAYLDFDEIFGGYFNAPHLGVMIRRNNGIKSLYPHPSRFINKDGKVILKPVDWADPRVNYKDGGKLSSTQ